MRKKRVLILYTLAGAGHIAAAKAMKEILVSRGFIADMIDPFDSFYDSFYKFLQTHARVLWNVIYKITDNEFCAKLLHQVNSFWFKDILEHILRNKSYDAVISVHGMLTSEVEAVLEKENLNIPFFIYITDPVSIHAIWLHSQKAHYLLPSNEAYNMIIQKKKNQTAHFVGWLLASSFYEKHEVVKENMFSMLIIGGANGAGIKHMVHAIMRNALSDSSKLTVICGRNESLKRSLEEEYKENEHIAVLGFVSNIAELMRSHDVIIGKAGTAVLYETISCLKPIIVTEKVLAQETGNVSLVEKHGWGWKISTTKELIKLINTLSRNKALLEKKRKQINKDWEYLKEAPNHFMTTLSKYL